MSYCGSCKKDPCLVDSNQVCCHTMIQYGYCQHEPLEATEETWDDVIADAEEDTSDPANDIQVSVPLEARIANAEARRAARPKRTSSGERAPRPGRR